MPDSTGREAHPEGEDIAFRLFNLATGEDEARYCRDIGDAECRMEPDSFVRQVAAQALAKVGDVLADPRLVLPWLLGALGVPGFFAGLLVPLREALALLPQILVGGLLRRFAVRKHFWTAASLVEGACVALIGAVGLAGLEGRKAGLLIVALLALFSLARGVASIAAKDTLGKTVSKGRRGQVSGYAASLSGAAAGLVGLYLVLSPRTPSDAGLLSLVLIAAGVCWAIAALVFAGIRETPGATEGGRGLRDLLREQAGLLREDRELRLFVLSRALMLSTALVVPVYVALAQQRLGTALDSLGWLILASGLAALSSAAIWGRLADRSSRRTMAAAAALAGVLGLATLVLETLASALLAHELAFALLLFVLASSHAGIRIARKTHIVDLAGGDRKAAYVALANTIIGVLLLPVGLLAGGLLALGTTPAIAVLSLLSLAGAGMALRLREVQA